MVTLVGLILVAGIGTYLYFSLGTRIVNGLDEEANLDPNDNRPVELRLTDEDIASMTDEEREKLREELGLPEDWDWGIE